MTEERKDNVIPIDKVFKKVQEEANLQRMLSAGYQLREKLDAIILLIEKMIAEGEE